jgi:hypothetical protein
MELDIEVEVDLVLGGFGFFKPQPFTLRWVTAEVGSCVFFSSAKQGFKRVSGVTTSK